ncbi:hypothetical protein DS843_23615 [Roseomonas genomospecies 6]|uniref:Uncharacterized protein n=1 Tax=Roseomonas genomospecies 6 TaxID=214106 RepID=A0A9W7NGQ0_9PROT|nr:hypothetical protein DS843_23615 [Roseomonas genomospecies 6]
MQHGSSFSNGGNVGPATQEPQHSASVSKHCDILAGRSRKGQKRSMGFKPVDLLLQPRDIFLPASGRSCDGIPQCQAVKPGPQ